MPEMVYAKRIGECADPALVGGKGASLTRMKRLGLPVPDGFTLTTEVWREMDGGQMSPARFGRILYRALRKFIPKGSIVSVRSGAPVSMPGMMDTILNIGATDTKLLLAYWRSLVKAVGVPEDSLTPIIDRYCMEHKVFNPEQIKFATQIEPLLREIKDTAKDELPDNLVSFQQKVRLAAECVLKSWDSERAQIYRRERNIDRSIGTSVTVQQMVFGTTGGSGVLLTRNPTTGEPEPQIDWVEGGQGDVVVDGSAPVQGAESLKETFPDAYAQLIEIGNILEKEYGDAMDIEFTIERDKQKTEWGGTALVSPKLWILQCRSMKRTSQAAMRIAVEMQGIMSQGKINSVKIVDEQTIEYTTKEKPFTSATPVVGRLVKGYLALGDKKHTDEDILFRWTTSPQDIGLMMSAAAILTCVGGPTCHAALVGREMNRPVFVGLNRVRDYSSKSVIFYTDDDDPITVNQGDPLTIFPNGDIYLGHVEVEEVSKPNEWAQKLKEIQHETT